MIGVVLAGSTAQNRVALASALAGRLGLTAADGFVLADPPADPRAFDAELARRGMEVDALVHLGGAPESLLDHYRRSIIESRSTDVDDILSALREAFAAAAG
jgi:hypothetical protein